GSLGGSTTPRRVEGAEPFAASTRGAAKYRVDPRRMWYSWKYLDEIRPFVKGPMLVKGIIHQEDAKVCGERGYDGIIVSNHGVRAMDYVPSTLEVLPEIVDAVGGKVTVLVESGLPRGA